MGTPITDKNLYRTTSGFGIDLPLPSGSIARLLCGDKRILIRVANGLYQFNEALCLIERMPGGKKSNG